MNISLQVENFKKLGIVADQIAHYEGLIKEIDEMKVERFANSFGEVETIQVAHLVGKVVFHMERAEPVVSAYAFHDRDWSPEWALNSFSSQKAAEAYAAAALERHLTEAAKTIRAQSKTLLAALRAATGE